MCLWQVNPSLAEGEVRCPWEVKPFGEGEVRCLW